MESSFLEKIIKHKKNLLKEKKAFYQALKDKNKKGTFTRYRLFKKAIYVPGKINLIAEIKKASPSRGLICRNFDVMNLARIYTQNGAAAISVLTEEKFFLGKPPYIRTVVENFQVPVLTKDFIIDEVQIYEAFSFEASAVLLIMAILEDTMVKDLMAVANQLDMECLVEVHDEKELKRALDLGAEIIGINNRDLHTFDVDLKVSEHLIPKIPKDKIIVVESGINTHEEILKFKELGAHAVLIGETFLKEADIAKKIKEVMYGQS